MNLFFIDLNHPAHYVNLGVLSISVGNLIMIASIVILFILAIAIPFPSHHDDEGDSQ